MSSGYKLLAEILDRISVSTPDMFAEYREPGFPQDRLDAFVDATGWPANDRRGDIRLLPSGPAFIMARPDWATNAPVSRKMNQVPDGYIWQPATDWTGAGWVRPHGERK